MYAPHQCGGAQKGGPRHHESPLIILTLAVLSTCMVGGAGTSDGNLPGWPEVAHASYTSEQRPLITTWQMDSANQTLTLPLSGFDMTIHWGDGTKDTGIGGTATHRYANPGTYVISIHGDLWAIQLSNSPDASNLVSINQWGDIKWETMSGAFAGATNMVYYATDTPYLSLVTDMSNMFRDAVSFNGDISSWDVSGITDMSNMFRNATSFNQPLNDWNVTSVYNMLWMFRDATSFNQPLYSWDVSGVDYMSSMFAGATSFNQPLGSWYVTINDTSIKRAEIPGVVGTISAQNLILDRQNPLYSIAPGADSERFDIINGNQLRIISASDKTEYTITITATGDSVFGYDGNPQIATVTLADDYRDTPPASEPPMSGQAMSLDDAESAMPLDLEDILLSIVNTLEVPGAVFGVGEQTYVTMTRISDNSTYILDITSPVHPVQVSKIPDSYNIGALTASHDVETFMVGDRTYAVVATLYDGGVHIVDVTDPAHPVQISTVLDGPKNTDYVEVGPVVEVFGIGDRTYALTSNSHDGRVSTVDITNPAQPVHTSMVFDFSEVHDDILAQIHLDVFGMGEERYALVAAWPSGWAHIVDITDPAQPVHISVVHEGLDVEGIISGEILPDTSDSDVSGPFAIGVFENRGHTYVFMPTINGIDIVDVTNPAQPASVHQGKGFDGILSHYLTFIPYYMDVFTAQNNVLIVMTTLLGGVHIIVDVTDPANPALVWPMHKDPQSLSLTPFITTHADVFVSGDRTYLLTTSLLGGTSITDITNPSNPKSHPLFIGSE